MNLEQLQAMNNEELNELSAVIVMEKLYQNGRMWVKIPNKSGLHLVGDWSPTSDMNDAMELWNKLHSEGWELNLSCDKKITTPWDCRLFLTDKDYNVTKRIITHNKTASRAITIASILAKGE